jgi:hypothetical protein
MPKSSSPGSCLNIAPQVLRCLDYVHKTHPITLNAARKGLQLATSKADTFMSFLIALTHIYLYYTMLLLPGTRLHLCAQVELLLLWVLRRLHAA